MARPKGLILHKPALTLYMQCHRLSLTETADKFGLNLPTLSGLASGNHGASISTVRQIEERAGTDAAEAIFPELSGRFASTTGFTRAVA